MRLRTPEMPACPPVPAARPRSDADTGRLLAAARIVVPLLFGLYSLWLGADANWDLYNYHLYNPFAWLHGKTDTDIAPAGLNSYFNPLLDLPLYWMNTHLPPRLVGFLMGWLHGLCFVLVLGIARRALPALPDEDRLRLPLLVALAGCLTANFLSGVGNSMGDDSTALFSLAALLVLLSNWEELPRWRLRSLLILAGSGVVAGLGVGLKPTNVSFAIALCLALSSYPERLLVRLRLSLAFGTGVLLGLGTAGGYWMYHLWATFGNPLYPQFGALFPNPLTQALNVADTRWLPHGALEAAFWPFVFSANSYRIGEVAIRQIIWLLVYLLSWAWIARLALARSMQRLISPLAAPTRFLMLYVVLAYLVWMQMFGYGRYLVPVEVLTPLAMFVLLERLLPYRSARVAAAGLIALAAAVVISGGDRSWGHQAWSEPLYHAEVPAIAQPERTTAIIASRHSAWAWLATLFPESVAFTRIESTFPGTELFREHIRERVKTRGGPAFAIIDGSGDAHARGEGGATAARDVAAGNRAFAADAASMFERNGFTLDTASCVPYRAGIGQGVSVYQWCRVSLR